MESFEGFMLNEGQKVSTLTEIDTAEINTKNDISKNKIDKHHPEDRVNETGDIPKKP